MEKYRKLTPHDLAFGIGRKATEEELKELVARSKADKGKRIDAMDALNDRKSRLADKEIKKAS
jgi:hypothetical protein